MMSKYLFRDIHLGIFRRILLYSIVIIFSLAMVNPCVVAISLFKDMGLLNYEGTILDYYVFSMAGMRYYRFNPKESFNLPLLWFAFQIGISYITAYYAVNDYSENGKNVIIAGKNRLAWWTSKMLWCALSVMVYYFISFLTCSVFALLHGARFSFTLSRKFFQLYFGYNTNYITDFDYILISIIVPLVTTISICLVQLLLSFVISPVSSFAISCSIYVLSAYYTTWLLPGSFTMWLRSSYFEKQGISPISGLLIATYLILVVCFVGELYFTKKDIL